MGKQSVRYARRLATGSRRPLCTVALGVVLSVGRSRDSPRAIPVRCTGRLATPRVRAACRSTSARATMQRARNRLVRFCGRC